MSRKNSRQSKGLRRRSIRNQNGVKQLASNPKDANLMRQPVKDINWVKTQSWGLNMNGYTEYKIYKYSELMEIDPKRDSKDMLFTWALLQELISELHLNKEFDNHIRELGLDYKEILSNPLSEIDSVISCNDEYISSAFEEVYSNPVWLRESKFEKIAGQKVTNPDPFYDNCIFVSAEDFFNESGVKQNCIVNGSDGLESYELTPRDFENLKAFIESGGSLTGFFDQIRARESKMTDEKMSEQIG